MPYQQAWGEAVFEFAHSMLDIMMEKCAFFVSTFFSQPEKAIFSKTLKNQSQYNC